MKTTISTQRNFIDYDFLIKDNQLTIFTEKTDGAVRILKSGSTELTNENSFLQYMNGEFIHQRKNELYYIKENIQAMIFSAVKSFRKDCLPKDYLLDVISRVMNYCRQSDIKCHLEIKDKGYTIKTIYYLIQSDTQRNVFVDRLIDNINYSRILIHE
jgi:hypothetical protein